MHNRRSTLDGMKMLGFFFSLTGGSFGFGGGLDPSGGGGGLRLGSGSAAWSSWAGRFCPTRVDDSGFCTAPLACSVGCAGIDGTAWTGATETDVPLGLASGAETVADDGSRWLDAARARGVESTGAEGGSAANCLLDAFDFVGMAFTGCDPEPALVKNVTSTWMFSNHCYDEWE